MRQLLEAGVHFGHQSHRWNPKMADYIFGARNNIHIIDLAQTVPLLHRALQAVSDTVAKGGRILFVGTKRQAQDGVAEAAKRSAQYFVNSRWLGGTLTNWKTISGSIKRLRHLDEVLNSGDANAYTKKEDIAIQEAQRLNIPVAAIVDTNSDPKGITYVVPGNDDAGRAITLYCDLIARAVIDGISRAQGDSGIDVGASAHPVREQITVAPQPVAFQGLAGPRGAADDLKKLTGVSGAIEKKFNDLGIFHYWQLAELDHDTAHKIGEEVGLPSRADGWVAQAKAMTAEAE
jgi:small subunit ribosomal protein S2